MLPFSLLLIKSWKRKLLPFHFTAWNFFSIFSRVGTVDLARNQLTKVEFQMFADLRFIDTIDLAENQISEVQREAFKNIYLTRINMSHNYIEEMAENAFRNCENMTVLGKKKRTSELVLPTYLEKE